MNNSLQRLPYFQWTMSKSWTYIRLWHTILPDIVTNTDAHFYLLDHLNLRSCWEPVKRQPRRMVKHNQAIRRQQLTYLFPISALVSLVSSCLFYPCAFQAILGKCNLMWSFFLFSGTIPMCLHVLLDHVLRYSANLLYVRECSCALRQLYELFAYLF